MATDYNRRITECERNSMDETILAYLTRHIVSHGEIEDHNALRDLMVASLPDYIEPVWQTMHNWYVRLGKRPPALEQQVAHGIPVRFPSGKRMLLQYTQMAANKQLEPMLELDGVNPNWVNIVDILGEERAAQLEEWSVTACQIASRVERSFRTASSITEIANTVGQLHRMCPDLVRYVFPQTAQALQTQVRRSPVPDEWMRIDRAAVADMVNHLALCYILPEQKVNKRNYREILPNVCWAFDRDTVRHASWSTHRTFDHKELSLCSADGNWSL